MSKLLVASRNADWESLGFVLRVPGGEWTMANIARPPCDEAAILAGSCGHPGYDERPWILAASLKLVLISVIGGSYSSRCLNL
jgi:hypothetical protein